MTLITRTQAAKLLDCSPQTVHNYAMQGLIDEVRRENDARNTTLYDEDQLKTLLPDLHDMAVLKAAVKAEQERLRQDLAALSQKREEARQEHFCINGGKKTYAHFKELIKAVYVYTRKNHSITRTKIEEDVLDRLLALQSVEEIMADTGYTKYTIGKAVNNICRYVICHQALMKENSELIKKNEKLETENRILRHTESQRTTSGKITIKSVDPTSLSVEEYKDIPVSSLNLPSNIIKALIRNSITNLYKLLSYSERELSNLPGINVFSAGEIHSYILHLGLRLEMTKDSNLARSPHASCFDNDE